MNDGKILAADFQFYANAGSTVDDSLWVGGSSGPPVHLASHDAQASWLLFLLQVAEKILLHLDNVYDIPNLRGRSAACRTNLPSNTAFRGFGVPQGLLVVENMINDVAMVLGCPADQVRPCWDVPAVVKVRSANQSLCLRSVKSTCTKARPSRSPSSRSARRTHGAAGTSARAGLSTAAGAPQLTASTGRTAGKSGASPLSPSNTGSVSPRAA